MDAIKGRSRVQKNGRTAENRDESVRRRVKDGEKSSWKKWWRKGRGKKDGLASPVRFGTVLSREPGQDPIKTGKQRGRGKKSAN